MKKRIVLLLTAAALLPTDSIVVAGLNELRWLAPVRAGEALRLEGKAVYAGQSSLILHVSGKARGEKVLEGFVTVVHVDKDGRAAPHGITVAGLTEEDAALQERAKKLARC